MLFSPAILSRRVKLLILLLFTGFLSLVNLKISHDNKELIEDLSPLENHNKDTSTYAFNRALSQSVILSEHQDNVANGHKDKKLPFHWYDWVDLTVLNDFINLPNKEKFDCSLVCSSVLDTKVLDVMKEIFKNRKQQELRPGRKRQNRNCVSYCRTDKSDHQPGFRIFRDLFKGSKQIKNLHRSSYLFSEAPNPYNLIFTTNNGNIKVPIQSNSKLKDHTEMNIQRSKLYNKYMSKEEQLQTNDYLKEMTNSEKFTNIVGLDPIDLAEISNVDLTHERFIFNGPEYLNSIRKDSSEPKEKFYDSLKRSLNTKEALLAKHFSESLLSRIANAADPDLHHTGDWRFYSGNALSKKEKMEVLTSMLKTWFQFTLSEGIISWLAHGGLLAHSFNGKLFPYDDDLDIQMPFQDLIKLAENFNNSLIFEDLINNNDANANNRVFYLDVTESISHRTKGIGQNNIDARLIDVDTGMFIDITGLGVSSGYLPMRYEDEVKAINKDEIKFEDPNVIIDNYYEPMTFHEKSELRASDVFLFRLLKTTQAFLKPPDKSSTLGYTSAERYNTNYQLEIYNCRNNHYYQLKDLSPLRVSYTNGIPILVPKNIDKVLREEYKPQLLLESNFQDWFYLPQIRLWVNKKILVKFYKENPNYSESNASVIERDLLLDSIDLNLLTQEDILSLLKVDKELLLEFIKSSEYTLLHEKEMMILKDKALEDSLVEGLLANRDFGLHKKEVNSDTSEDVLAELAKEQLNGEYSDSIPFHVLGRNKDYQLSENEIDYNGIGWSLKKILELYQQDKSYNPDISLKLSLAEKSLARAEKEEKEREKKTKNSISKNEYKELVQRYTDEKAKMIEKLKSNTDTTVLPDLKIDNFDMNTELNDAPQSSESEQAENDNESS